MCVVERQPSSSLPNLSLAHVLLKLATCWCLTKFCIPRCWRYLIHFSRNSVRGVGGSGGKCWLCKRVNHIFVCSKKRITAENPPCLITFALPPPLNERCKSTSYYFNYQASMFLSSNRPFSQFHHSSLRFETKRCSWKVAGVFQHSFDFSMTFSLLFSLRWVESHVISSKPKHFKLHLPKIVLGRILGLRWHSRNNEQTTHKRLNVNFCGKPSY